MKQFYNTIFNINIKNILNMFRDTLGKRLMTSSFTVQIKAQIVKHVRDKMCCCVWFITSIQLIL